MEEPPMIKWHIFHTLGKLLEVNTLDKLSVKDICKACNISRQTFYRHFPDKYSIVNWHFDLLSEDTLKQIGRTLTWYQAHVKLFTYFYNERTVYTRAYSKDYNALDRYAYRQASKIFIETLTEYKKINPTQKLLFQADAAALLCSILSSKWIFGGMKETPDEIATLLDAVLPQELKSILEKDLPSIERARPLVKARSLI